MPLTISLDNSAVCDLALALAKLSPLEAAATIRELKTRPSFRGVNWDVIMAGAVQAAAEATPVGTGLGIPSSATALLGQFGTTGLRITGETIGAASALDVSDQGGVSNPAIYDAVSAVNAANDTGILDVTPWRVLVFSFSTSAGTSALQLKFIDDAGAAYATQNVAAIAAALGGVGVGIGSLGMTAGYTFQCALPRRLQFICGAAGVGNTVRLRIEGRR